MSKRILWDWHLNINHAGKTMSSTIPRAWPFLKVVWIGIWYVYHSQSWLVYGIVFPTGIIINNPIECHKSWISPSNAISPSIDHPLVIISHHLSSVDHPLITIIRWFFITNNLHNPLRIHWLAHTDVSINGKNPKSSILDWDFPL